MASKTTKTKKKQTKKDSAALKRNFRLGFGLLLFLVGGFLTMTIISYLFHWKQDQDVLFHPNGIIGLLGDGTIKVHNWGGRLGAAFSHLLVYEGLGVMSLMLTVWLGVWGYHLLNGRQLFPGVKWLRWLAFSFLFFCPLLAFVFANSSFPLGGALGNGLIGWTRGFAGNVGIIGMIIAMLAFFTFVIFKWDVQPLVRHAKTVIPGRIKKALSPNDIPLEHQEGDTFKGYRHPTPEEDAALSRVIDETHATEEGAGDTPFSGNVLQEGPTPSEAKEAQSSIDLEMTIIDHTKEEEPERSTGSTIESKKEEGIEIIDFTQEEPLAFKVTTTKDEELISDQKHITIESGEPYDPSLDLSDYKYPTLALLETPPEHTVALDHEELNRNKNQIIETLQSFNIEIEQISATVGPTVTLYEIVPEKGIRISKIRNLEDDIALSLAALGIRIIAPIPGKGTIGIEVPNKKPQIVYMRTILSSEKFINNTMDLPIALGKKIDNKNYIVDLAKMPHLLMAGATGQGKSVGINAILISLLYKKHPSQLKFVMVDPKKVELSIYRVIEKHYLAKLPNEEEAIITDYKKVVNTLNALTIEMDNRYELLKDAATRNIKEYNAKFIKRKLNPNDGHRYLPFIVLVVDEFADLIMTAGKEVEEPIARLAQLARAVGIHLIIATQRPSVNVITGIIKANFPARIAFKVSSKVDSRTILDTGGADQLIGRGDMLISYGSELLRLQCAFVDTPEVERIVNFIGEQRGYPSAFLLPEPEVDGEDSKADVDLSKRDKLFDDCARLVVSSQSGSTSMLQRKFNIGYNRAGRIMDQLEAAGIVGGQLGSKPREVYVYSEQELDAIIANI